MKRYTKLLIIITTLLSLQPAHAAMSLKHKTMTLAGCILPAVCTQLLLNRYISNETSWNFYGKLTISAIAGMIGLYFTSEQTPNAQLYWVETETNACESSKFLAIVEHHPTIDTFLCAMNEANNYDYTGSAIIHSALLTYKNNMLTSQNIITNIRAHHKNDAELLSRCELLEQRISSLTPLINQSLEYIEQFPTLGASKQLYKLELQFQQHKITTAILIAALTVYIALAHIKLSHQQITMSPC